METWSLFSFASPGIGNIWPVSINWCPQLLKVTVEMLKNKKANTRCNVHWNQSHLKMSPTVEFNMNHTQVFKDLCKGLKSSQAQKRLSDSRCD